MKPATQRARLIAPRSVAELHVLEIGLELIVRHIEHLPSNSCEIQDIARDILSRLEDES